jgi:hypothetical protein
MVGGYFFLLERRYFIGVGLGEMVLEQSGGDPCRVIVAKWNWRSLMPQRRSAMLRSLLVLVSLIVLCALLSHLMLVPRISMSGFRSRIEAELPLGTDRMRVESWLTAQGFPWSDIIDEDGRRVGICGTLRHLYRLEFFGETQIDFEFHFDRKEQLIEVSVEEVTVGL